MKRSPSRSIAIETFVDEVKYELDHLEMEESKLLVLREQLSNLRHLNAQSLQKDVALDALNQSNRMLDFEINGTI